MWRFVCCLLIVLSCLCGYIFVTLKSDRFDDLEEIVDRTDKNGAAGKIKHHIPKFMLDLYEQSKNSDRTRPDVVRSVIPTNAGSLHDNDITNGSLEDNHLLTFTIPASDAGEKFVAAELRIFTIVQVDPKYLTGVERLIKISIYNETSKRLVQFDEVHVYHTGNTWLSFNLTGPVGSSPKTLKIAISVRAFLTSSGRFKLSINPESLEHDYPILLLSYSSHEKTARKKRNLEEEFEEETNSVWDDQNRAQEKKLKRLKNTCRKRSLYVNFAEIHYDSWIVQPSGYEAYQCSGKCFYPVAEHLSPTKHAIVQALMHSVNPSTAVRSCCAPTRLDSISLLYLDSRNVLTYKFSYKDMVVAECGCR